MAMRCAVIVPTYQAARYLPPLVERLARQSVAADTLLIIDSSSSDGTADLARSLGCRVEVIPKAEFNHGGTRNRAAMLVDAELLVFMTQDALPADDAFLEHLTAPLRTGGIAASFARQLPRDDAVPPERIARAWNYPPVSSERSAADIPKLGIKAFFFSNVASAVRRDRFVAIAGFPADVIMNEDMVLCAKLLAAGDRIAYRADAAVRHSHNYPLIQQFRRYFDIGAFFASHGALLPGGGVGSEGLRFACSQFLRLVRDGHPLWALRSPIENAAKLLAYQLGKRNAWLPNPVRCWFSMHPFHWRQQRAGDGQPGRP
jgi:rhamnosyltransferase